MRLICSPQRTWRCHGVLLRAATASQLCSGTNSGPDDLFFRNANRHPPSRIWSRNASNAPGKSGHPPVFLGSWLTTQPSKVRPEDIIARLPPLPVTKNHKRHTALFLVTPAFASWLEPEATFLKDAMQKLYASHLQHHFHEYLVNSIAAVVDRLPGPSSCDIAVGQQIAISRGQADGVSSSEGVALHVNDYSNLREEESIAQNPAAGARDYHISFQSDAKVTMVAEDKQIQTKRGVKLRLANTLFHNGQPATIVCDQWKAVEADGPIRRQFTKVSQRHARSLFFLLRSAYSESLNPELPLYPLTQPRQIVDSMGNILSKLSGDEDGSVITASSELEKAVPTFLENQARAQSAGSHGGILQIFAAVRPAVSRTSGHVEVSESAVSLPAAEAVKDLEGSLWTGARLHRVTSGGGGWGKKQGLLSLDPAIDFSEAENVVSSMPGLDADDGEAGDQAAGRGGSTIVPQGHTVQFFASFQTDNGSNISSLYESASETAEQRPQTSGDGSTTPVAVVAAAAGIYPKGASHIFLGVIPPQDPISTPTQSALGISSDSNSPSTTPADPVIQYFPNHFGMLSESGACFEIVERSKNPSDRPNGPANVSFSSRVDVPFATFTTRAFTTTGAKVKHFRESQEGKSGKRAKGQSSSANSNSSEEQPTDPTLLTGSRIRTTYAQGFRLTKFKTSIPFKKIYHSPKIDRGPLSRKQAAEETKEVEGKGEAASLSSATMTPSMLRIKKVHVG